MKTCNQCGAHKPFEEFTTDKRHRDGRVGKCIECRRPGARAATHKYRNKTPENRERLLQAKREWWANLTPEERRDWRVRSKFQLPKGKYAEMLEAQNGVCAVCEKPDKAGLALGVDHDHACCPGKTSCGECVRALLCGDCNRALGLMKEDVGAIMRLAVYVRGWS